MGSIYQRTEWYCRTCPGTRRERRRATTAERNKCKAAGHEMQECRSPVYWIKYTRAGKSYDESSRSKRKADARTLLQEREGDIVRGKPVTPKIGKLSFEDAAADLLADYRTNGRRSQVVVERRVRKHLTPFFGGRRMADITTSDIRAYITERQTANTVLVRKARTVTLPDGTKETRPEERHPASNAEINRELALLKRMFSLAMQAAKLLYKPHIPMLRENNVRTGFFEREQFDFVMKHLPGEIRPLIRFAYVTGWRIASEVLPLQWRHVDFEGDEIRLDAGTTKNGEGRVFPMTEDLRTLLKAQHAEHERLKKAGHIAPWVFFRMVAEGRGGDKKPQPIVSFTKAWKSACRAAGCPGRIPHDLRRTAVRSLVRAGIPERVAMRMTGHKTPSVFHRYNIVSEGDLREAAHKLNLAAVR